MTELSGKIAIITGASSGIGRAFAKRALLAGAKVVMVDVQEERGMQVAKELGEDACFRRCDVSSEAALAAVIDQTIALHGQLDIMCNNAGIGGVVGPIDQLPATEFDDTAAVLFRGVFLGLKHAARVMKPKGRGTIINVASVAGSLAGLSPHVYAACKAAVLQLTRSVATELGEQGIRVNAVSPGAIATPLASEFLSGDYGHPERIRDQLQEAQPLERPGLPHDVAEALLWLASDASAFVNGHNLVVDGGLSCGVRWSETPGPWLRQHTPMRRPR